MKEYSKMLKNMFQFEGRARRREYWVCSLINAAIRSVFLTIMILGATVVGDPLFYNTGSSVGFNTRGSLVATILFVLAACVYIFLFVSMLGMTVRRYHDAGLPGWVYPICIAGTILCCIGAIANFVICLLPSKEDNVYGENPKKPELDEYEGTTSIILSIVLAAVGSFIVSIAVFCNIHFCGLGNNISGNGIISGNTTEEIIDVDTEEDTEITEDTESTEEIEATTEAEEPDIDDNTDEGVPSDSGAFPLEIGNVTLQLTFDPGATVYATDYSVRLSRKYDNDATFEIEYEDSYSEVGDTEYLYVSDYYDGIDGYTLVESKEKELLEDGSSYVSYNIYQDEDGKYYVNATIWQDIGAGNYLEIKVETDATNNIEDVIDGSIISL